MEKLKIQTGVGGLQSTVALAKFPNAKAIFCGHCGNCVGMDVYMKFYEKNLYNQEIVAFEVGVCPICGKPIIYDATNDNILPAAKMFESVSCLPQNIELLYGEMRDAFAAGAYTCCVIAGRTLLAHIAVEQGAEQNKSFVYYVNYLVDNFLPKNSSKPWVDRVRQLGNESAHELVIAVKKDAESSMKFLSTILKVVYEYPNLD